MINTNIKKQYQQTTWSIQRLNTSIQLLSIGVIFSEKFSFRKCVCCWQVCLAWKTISCLTDMCNRIKHSQIWQGTCEEDVGTKVVWKLFEICSPSKILEKKEKLQINFTDLSSPVQIRKARGECWWFMMKKSYFFFSYSYCNFSRFGIWYITL